MSSEVPIGVSRLLAAIHQGGDFPAMAHTVEVISSLTSSEKTSSQALADTILHDYGLTQKLLRMVNTLAYTQYGEVTTITRAVLLMGFERVRLMTTSLIMFEHFRKQANNPTLVDVLNKAFYSAVLGRSIAQASGAADAEEAFISTLYHRLGTVLLAFYLPDDYAAIQAVPESERDKKAHEILGVSRDRLGSLIAQGLKMPERLQQTMRPMDADDLRRPLAPHEQLSCLASVSNQLTDVMVANGDIRVKRAEVEKLAAQYDAHLPMKEGIHKVIARAVKDVKSSSGTFKLRLAGTKLMTKLSDWATPIASNADDMPTDAASLKLDVFEVDAPPPDPPETILARGIQEISALLIGEYTLDDVLRVVLESMYRALGVDKVKVLFLLKDPTAPVARFRFGFGHDPEDEKLWQEVRISGSEDLLSQAVLQEKDFIIRNVRIPSVSQALPPWLIRRGVLDRYVLLLPLVIERRPLGLFYVDGAKEASGVLTPAVLNQMKLLRGQVQVAIRRRTGRGATTRPT